MTQLTALKELEATLETGTQYETMGHTRQCQLAFPKPEGFDGSREAYRSSDAQQAVLAWRNNSLDAAKSLHEAVLPGWDARLYLMSGEVWVYTPVRNGPPGAECEASIPNNMARAWLLAILRAKISELESEDV